MKSLKMFGYNNILQYLVKYIIKRVYLYIGIVYGTFIKIECDKY